MDETMTKPIKFFVPGIPKPGGSKQARVIRRKGGEIVTKNGRPLVIVHDACKGNRAWRDSVKAFAVEAFKGAPLDGPLSLAVTFVLLVATRSIFGIFGSGAYPASQAYIADRTSAQERTEGMATLNAAFGLGAAIGPGIGHDDHLELAPDQLVHRRILEMSAVG